VELLDQLQSHLSNTFRLISENEEILQTSSRPEERLRSEWWITRYWRMIAQWIVQAKSICQQQSRQMPKWLLEYEAAVPSPAWGELKKILGEAEHLPDQMPEIVSAFRCEGEESSSARSRVGSQKTPMGSSCAEDTTDMAKIIQFPATKMQDPFDWNESTLQCAKAGLVLQQTQRILEGRRSFRVGELSDVGSRIREASVWVNRLEAMVMRSPEVLLQRTARRRAIDDLRQIRDLAKQIELGLSSLDIEITLGKSLTPQAFDSVCRNIRAMDHYVASACDWMTLGRVEASST
jgi:hypothetical protein